MPRNLPGTVGRWSPTLDDAGNGTATLHDLSGNGNHGTLLGMNPATDWPVNTEYGGKRALDFDGSNDLVDCGNGAALQLTGAMSLSVWFQGKSSNSGRIGVGKFGPSNARGYQLTVNNSDEARFTLSSDPNTFINTTAVGHDPSVWMHYVGIFDPGNSLRLYRNSALVAEETSGIPTAQYSAANPFKLGRRDGTSSKFDGLIDDVILFDRVLTLEEIAALFSQRGYEVPLPVDPEIEDGGDIHLEDGGVIEPGYTEDGGIVPALIVPITANGTLSKVLAGQTSQQTIIEGGHTVTYKRELTDLQINATFSVPAIVRVTVSGQSFHRSDVPESEIDLAYTVPNSDQIEQVEVSIDPGELEFSETVFPQTKHALSIVRRPASLTQKLSSYIESQLAGHDPSTDKFRWSPMNHDTLTYTANPTFWGSDIDLAACSVWNSADNGSDTNISDRLGASLITPTCLLIAKHTQASLANGVQFRFVDSSGTIITRTRVEATSIAGADLTVVLLDAPVTTIQPFDLPPFGWEQNFGGNGIHCLVGFFDKQEKLSVGMVNDLNSANNTIGVGEPVETEAARTFSEAVVGGDSGKPVLALGFVRPVLITVWSAPFLGSAISHHRSAIDQACQTLASETPTTTAMQIAS